MSFFPKPHKYGAQRTTVDGISFASKAEAKRYTELRLLAKAGIIRDLELQPRYKLAVKGLHVCEYRADFSYVQAESGHKVTEDVKGVRTESYKLKRRLMQAVYGITIMEFRGGKPVDPDAPKPRRRRRKKKEIY